MDWVPAFKIGLWNAWLFMIVYPLQWLIVVLLPKRLADRTAHPADEQQGRKGNALDWATQALWVGATLYSIFLPLRVRTGWLCAGLIVFAAGLAVLISATAAVYRTPPGEPFTRGIYRFSRHPMYLSMILVYTAVSLAASSWLFFLITAAAFFLQRRQMIMEEDACRRRFGRPYMDYMESTPRWFGPYRSVRS
jgi:protein-S-isoprenylcysteine O-methyltransferase Ste14